MHAFAKKTPFCTNVPFNQAFHLRRKCLPQKIRKKFMPRIVVIQKNPLVAQRDFFVFANYFAQFALRIARLSMISLGILSPKLSA